MSKTFSVTEQAEKITDVLRKGINGYVKVSIELNAGGDWDTYPIFVTIHNWDNFDIKHYIVIIAFSKQEEGLTDKQRFEAPLVEGIEMEEPDTNKPERVRKAYHKLKKHFEKEGFGVYDSWEDFFN